MAYHYPVIYWNTANLISDSGGEDGNTNYGKISRAIGNIKKEGVAVALPDINRVRFGFHPDVDRNEIVYGLKPVQGVGAAVAKAIIDRQPYASMQDFYDKMQEYKAEAKENKFGDMAMISLIKAGCFDEVEHRDRKDIMVDFIKEISNPIKSLKMDNIEDLNNLGLLTDAQKKYELRLYRFKKYLYQPKFFTNKTGKSPATEWYKLDHKFAEPFFNEHFVGSMTEGKDYQFTEDGFISVKRGSIERVFDKLISDFKEKVLDNQEFLSKINNIRFDEMWEDKASGSISKWEMDSLCMYYHEHELAHVNRALYNIKNFDEMPEEPEIADKYFWRGQEKARFKLYRICGTVLDKDKTRHTVTLLTPDGVVDVKFYRGAFSYYDKQIVELNDDGTKTTLEKSWFSRGTKLLVTGFRRGEQFVPRKYSDSIFKHTVQLINDISDTGDLTLVSDRVDVGEEDTL